MFCNDLRWRGAALRPTCPGAVPQLSALTLHGGAASASRPRHPSRRKQHRRCRKWRRSRSEDLLELPTRGMIQNEQNEEETTLKTFLLKLTQLVQMNSNSFTLKVKGAADLKHLGCRQSVPRGSQAQKRGLDQRSRRGTTHRRCGDLVEVTCRGPDLACEKVQGCAQGCASQRWLQRTQKGIRVERKRAPAWQWPCVDRSRVRRLHLKQKTLKTI